MSNVLPLPAWHNRNRHALADLLLAALILAGALPPAVTAADNDPRAQSPAATGNGEENPRVPGPFAESTLQFDFGKGLLARRLYAEAAATFARFLKTYPGDPRVPLARYWHAEAMFGLSRFDAAAQEFYRFLNKYPGHARHLLARLRYGCCLFELKQYAKAVKALAPVAASAKTRAPARNIANYYLGRSHFALKQYAPALAALTNIKDGALAASALFTRGQVRAAQGRHAAAAEDFGRFLQRFPEHDLRARAWLWRGRELRAMGKLEEAASCLQRLGQLKHLAPELLRQSQLELAWVRLRQGQTTAARAIAVKLIGSGQPTAAQAAEASYLAGLCSLKQGDPQAAIAAFAKVDSGPFAQDAMRRRAWALLAAGKARAALSLAGAFTDKFPRADRLEIIYLRGRAHSAAKEYDAAATAFLAVRKAKAAYHKDAAYALAYAYDQAGRHEFAAAAYAYFAKNFPRSPYLADALLGQARSLQAGKHYAEAIPVYARLLEEKRTPPPLREQALLQQASCFYYLKQYANMAKCYNRLLHEFPKSPQTGEALYWLAWYDFFEKRFRKAAERYGEVVARFPHHTRAPASRYRQAMSWFQAGEADKAAQALYVILTKFPDINLDQQEILWLGQYFVSHSRLEQAYTVYDVLLARSPGKEVRSLALYYQAEVRRRARAWKAAGAKYRRLLAEKETGLENAARFGLAVCLRHLRQRKEARKLLLQVRLSPSDPLVAYYHYELGVLDLEAGKYASAAESLLRVGILYDQEDLCGRALLKAYEAARLGKDTRKAVICLNDLAGKSKASYGQRYPHGAYTAEGKRLLAAFAAGKGLLPAREISGPAKGGGNNTKRDSSVADDNRRE